MYVNCIELRSLHPPVVDRNLFHLQCHLCPFTIGVYNTTQLTQLRRLCALYCESAFMRGGPLLYRGDKFQSGGAQGILPTFYLCQCGVILV